MRLSLFLLSTIALAACAPKEEAPAASNEVMMAKETTAPDSQEDHFPKGDPAVFMGKWKVSEGVTAPWWDKKGDTPDAYLKNETIEFTPTSTMGPGITQCAEAIYDVKTTPVEALFEGGLQKEPTDDPWKAAEALGFTAKMVPVLNQGCKSSTGDLELQFAQKNEDTLMLGLDNVLYTLTRVK